MMTRKFLFICLCAVFILSASHDLTAENQKQMFRIKTIPSPSGEKSGEPNIFADVNGKVFLSWIEPGKTRKNSLLFSELKDGSWSQPHTISEGDEWFVNWADFPSLISFADGHIMAHWLERSGESVYAYDIRISQSFDSGKTWSKAITPHRDGTETEHGFLSMVPWDKNKAFLVWLDGRQMVKKSNEPGGHNNQITSMTLRTAFIDRENNLSGERMLDNRVCECCPTSVALTPSGAVVVYRNRSEEEIRDISIVRYKNGNWSKPKIVSRDGWKINACPVNGPAVSASGKNIVVAWFTNADKKARVKAAFSENEGKDFQTALIIDDGDPIGRMAALLLDDGSAMVCWMEKTSEDAEIKARRVWPGGKMDQSFTVAKTSRQRSSGFPRMVRSGNKIYFAWTQPGESLKINTAVAVY